MPHYQWSSLSSPRHPCPIQRSSASINQETHSAGFFPAKKPGKIISRQKRVKKSYRAETKHNETHKHFTVRTITHWNNLPRWSLHHWRLSRYNWTRLLQSPQLPFPQKIGLDDPFQSGPVCGSMKGTQNFPDYEHLSLRNEAPSSDTLKPPTDV